MLRIVKLGGSLLDWEPHRARLRRWLEEQPPAKNLVVVGGGPLVQLIRQRDRHRTLGEARCHWLAIEAMRVTGRRFAQDWPGADLACDPFLAARSHPAQLSVLDVGPFLRELEPTCQGRPLSQGWEVTSDSIAARIAQVVRADELVLLKSTLPHSEDDWLAASRAGVVDGAFPEVVACVPIARCVNLRQVSMPVWQPKKITPPTRNDVARLA